MGLFFTLLYVGVAYITPTVVFGPLAAYHIQVVLALLAFAASLLTAQGSRVFAMPQTYALAGLTMAVALSIIFSGWLGGAPVVLLEFIPTVAAFFFIVLSCRKKGHLQALVLVLVGAALYTVLQGHLAVRADASESPYLLSMSNEAGQKFYRTRGLGFINDPNDFAQFLVALLPCTFFSWRKGRLLANLLLVIFPATGLVYGMYLTHSRGGMLALLAIALVAGRRKIGVLPALVVGGLLFVGLSASGWSGGRDVSAASGEDRMEAWSTGLELIRSHPVFGVGYLHFADYYIITAHNTVVVCAAEIGVFGFFFWVLYAFSTMRDAVAGARGKPETNEEENRELVAAAHSSLPLRTHKAVAAPLRNRSWPPASAPAPLPWELSVAGTELPDEEIRRLLGLMVLSFTGFFTAGWFLSRAYTMGLFINGAMVAVLYRMAQDKGVAPPRLTVGRLLRHTGLLLVGLIGLVYLILRMSHLLGK